MKVRSTIVVAVTCGGKHAFAGVLPRLAASVSRRVQITAAMPVAGKPLPLNSSGKERFFATA